MATAMASTSELAWLPAGSGFVYSFTSRQSTRLTNFSSDFAGQLSVSPDGQSIVFERSTSTDDQAPTDFWLVNRDGSGQRLVVRNAARPAWSPRKVATLSSNVHLSQVTR